MISSQVTYYTAIKIASHYNILKMNNNNNKLFKHSITLMYNLRLNME